MKEFDRSRIGRNYEVVTSGAKPSTEWGRLQKPRINKLCRDMGMRFISYASIRRCAEKWYKARVIRGSVTEAASEYGVYRPTFENEIKLFDQVAGLR